MILYNNRREAGDILAQQLLEWEPLFTDPVVLGIPRGGVPIGYQIAKTLHTPLAVLDIGKESFTPVLEGRTVIVAEDGLSSGISMAAAIRFIKQQGAGEVIVAVPVVHQEGYGIVKKETDRIFALHISRSLSFSEASFYREFPDVTEHEIANFVTDTLQE